MQLIIRNMTLVDFIKNVFYKVRLQVYRLKWRINNNIVNNHYDGELEFHCDFKGDKLDTEMFNVGEHWGKVHPRYLNTYWGEPSILKNVASFGTIKEPKVFKVGEQNVEIPYKCGKISSYKSFKQKYGYWEAKCMVPVEKGVRSSFWLWGDGDGEPYREIDIFEVDGLEGKQKINIHYGDRKDGKSQQLKTWKLNSIIPGRWQRFGLNWEEDKIEMFVDGLKVFQLTNKKILDQLKYDQWVVMGQDVIGEPNDKSLPMLVDYIRVFSNV